MLTKDLIRFKSVGGRIKPGFVDTADRELLAIAEGLLGVYRESEELTRGELEERAEPLIKSFRDQKIAKGLDKLILDKCSFSPPADYDYAKMRQSLFATTASLFSSRSGVGDYDSFKESLASMLPAEMRSFIDAGIYSDLPEHERLVSLPTFTPLELLERYNCSLVQSLLLYSERLDISLAEAEVAKIRRLFKYLKFFRLTASIKGRGCSKKRGGFGDAKGAETLPSCVDLIIDGPAAILDNSRKYGLQLACFFPAVCDMPKWSVQAKIKFRKRDLKLKLDQNSGLVGHYRNFSAYVPEEIAMFHKLFKERVDEWRIIGETPFFHAGGGDIIFPDLSFKDDGGNVVYLELFHRWHSHQLLTRLDYCKKHQDLSLIIGVDRFLASKVEFKRLLGESEFFSQNGFLFRDFPGVATVKKCLNRKAGLLLLDS